ncbi:MAG: c-type cytochrome [Maritimibacter sp.]|nr:c-type cytochrome [Maritimibacter sp.]
MSRPPLFATSLAATLLSAAVLAAPAFAAEIGDPAVGEAVFKKECSKCHQVGDDAKHRIGPVLNGVFGAVAGSQDDFKYSKGMQRMHTDGLTWTLETLDAYLTNPRALVSGTRMSFAGLKDEDERHGVLAYLRQYSDNPQNIPEAEPTAVAGAEHVSAEVLAIVGDVEFGEYLANECQTCHQKDGVDEGIPSIVSWPEEDFVVAMHAYKQELRPHPVMQMMAKRLNDEEIAALAAYFATLE